MMRTARGRVATSNAYLHFGLTPPARESTPECRFSTSLTRRTVVDNPDAPFAWPIRVYYEDTDAQGVVYYANYFKFMERARTEWIRALGIEQDVLLSEQRRMFVVVDTQAEFRMPAKFNDQTGDGELHSRARASFCHRPGSLSRQSGWRAAVSRHRPCRVYRRRLAAPGQIARHFI